MKGYVWLRVGNLGGLPQALGVEEKILLGEEVQAIQPAWDSLTALM